MDQVSKLDHVAAYSIRKKCKFIIFQSEGKRNI